MNELSPEQQAKAALSERAQEEAGINRAYERLFATKDGKDVLADIQRMFPHDLPRFAADTTKANPVAAIIGGIHFDGSARVVKHILDRMEAAKRKPAPAPEVHTT